MKIVAAGIAVLIVAAVGIYIYKTRPKKDKNVDADSDDLLSEIIDGELTLDAVIAFFKSKSLDIDKHKPFIANSFPDDEWQKKCNCKFPPKKDGYVSILLGVYNEKADTVEYIKIVYAKSLDKKLLDVFGNDKLVVLR